MDKDKDKIDVLHVVINDEPNMFVSHHTRLRRCDCGCGTLHMLLCNEDNEILGVAAHLPQQWIDICRTITNESIAMMKGEKGQVGYPPKKN